MESTPVMPMPDSNFCFSWFPQWHDGAGVRFKLLRCETRPAPRQRMLVGERHVA